jgi:hypothetical protein
MAKGFTLNFVGLKETIAKLEDKGDDIKTIIDAEMAASVTSMETEAKQRAPVRLINGGFLRASISGNKLAPFLYELVAQKDYAAYVEFGTGKYASSYVPSIDEEWQILAKQFYINGQGRTPNQPYLYPSYKRQLPLLLNRIEKVVEQDERL